MSEWTWLHQYFPIADIELMGPPIPAKAANVLVRTVRLVSSGEERTFTVRVAPHPVAPFQHHPWIQSFSENELLFPGNAVRDFRINIYKDLKELPPFRK
ncbi:hypothetical protein ACOJUR_11710 [Alicyclobacillus tolerans]|uniref:hypothetical protein n=1 Tax=Alicyclobacillus tolerans TaxID=90970 RepID=UPI003B7F08F8